MGLFAELPEKIAELIRGKKEGAAPKYTYDANSQKYSTSSAPTDGTPAPAQMKKGGKVSSASSRADGIATKGKTKGRFV